MDDARTSHFIIHSTHYTPFRRVSVNAVVIPLMENPYTSSDYTASSSGSKGASGRKMCWFDWLAGYLTTSLLVGFCIALKNDLSGGLFLFSILMSPIYCIYGLYLMIA
ncbi:MAG: hypothetical protein AAGA30_13030, partial [Planctomycetota bacterium]